MTSDISGVQRTISGTLVSILQNSSLLVLALMAMFRKSWILASLGLIPVPLFVLPTKKVGKKRWEMTGLVQEKNDQINQLLNESLSVSGQKLAKLFNKQEEDYQAYYRINREMTELSLKESLAGRWFRLTISILSP